MTRCRLFVVELLCSSSATLLMCFLQLEETRGALEDSKCKVVEAEQRLDQAAKDRSALELALRENAVELQDLRSKVKTAEIVSLLCVISLLELVLTLSFFHHFLLTARKARTRAKTVASRRA